MRFPWRRFRVLAQTHAICPECNEDLKTEGIPVDSQATVRCPCGTLVEVYPDMRVEKRGVQ